MRDQELYIGNRVIILIGGFILACSALLGASEMSMGSAFVFNFTVSIGTIAGVVGVVLFSMFVRFVTQGDDFRDVESAVMSATIAVCFAYLFGAIATPTDRTADIQRWVTPWSFLLILGVLPMVFVMKDVVVDMLAHDRALDTKVGQ